ncbi:MAG: alpha-1,2-fucosyltransferase [Dysgonamonadaceae bacterium]|jgi:hypothetical protein|nr:alpha-1,2-fucosyltransferase [Dysgonamonadaceae bacterium]
MVIVALSGGLGNQMSQYAFYLTHKYRQEKVFFNTYLIRRNNQHNGYELNSIFNIPDESYYIHDLLIRLVRKLWIFKNRRIMHLFVRMILKFLSIIRINIINERPDYRFDEHILSPPKGINIYRGGWHSEKYFKDKQWLIRKLFQFNTSQLNELSKKILDKISQGESISLHVRKGDYNNSEWDGVCSIDYYKSAIRFISDKVADPSFFCFSDDMDWVKTHLHIPDATYIEHNGGINSWQDMFLMSRCKHHIVANSTFSWWGAWLGMNTNKRVIAPPRFMRTQITPDFFPAEWIQMDVKTE